MTGAPGATMGEAIVLDPCLARLDEAVAAARRLGVEVAEAESVAADAAVRLGFPADAFVIALVGGTGVGKSSLLNGLAGADVSAASVRRPTTASPVAWLPGASVDALRPVLDWLGVAPGDRRMSERNADEAIAILDLPDLDSIEPDHRRRVEEVLPRVDGVIWVTDPEKYHDALLHDDFLARWLPRLGRQLVVINKSDRLAPDDGEQLRRDLQRDIERLGRTPDGAASRPRVVLATTRRSADAPDGLAEVRRWLAEGVEAKQVVRARLIATIRATIDGLARAAGIQPAEPERAILSAAARETALERATGALLRVVDLPALRRQAVAATRARARARGAGPLGGLTSRLFRWSGRQARVADPASYLARWRDRGTTGAAVGELRSVLGEPLRTAAPGTRRVLADASSAASLERDLGSAVDRAIASDPGEPPTSPWWTGIGSAQTVATGALVLSAIWVVLWILIRFPADSVILPMIGQVPIPIVAIVVSLVTGYLLARLLGAHAGWLGRRWANALADRIRGNVQAEVGESAFAAIDRLEIDRHDLWTAARGAGEDCARV
jgi:hypothetical protein